MEDPVEKTNETLNADRYQALTVIGHLQSLFALMQYGNTKSIDPTDFIQCLRLDTNTQQDAQVITSFNLYPVNMKRGRNYILILLCS